ncbi:hypothetical protein BJI67_01430 [Acidihalobacter aeolianus]|uniref:Uncharacterized protein n=1 Tax=Acidihalobacter aeolianus TaxID=2792603 RepID=A0A1D8KBJ6_9GAMM|nr:DUF6516 family protein [Acidihalobacter aeolianus]AOV18343.1 hypothetical protein BJI67_01430 [Acidihalobacter aeolianus]
MRRDYGLDTLLGLDQVIIAQDCGYWVKFEVSLVEVTNERPHGIKYSLTLHDRYSKRVMGYDNAHAVRLPRKHKYAGQRARPHDHKHQHSLDKGVPYEFQDADQLLVDFWSDVDRVLKEVCNK